MFQKAFSNDSGANSAGDTPLVMRLGDYIGIFKRRRKIFTVFFVVTVLAVALGSLLMTPIYRATVTLLIDEESPNILTTSGSVALDSQSYYSYREYYQTQVEIIKSEGLAGRVFKEFNLGVSKEYSGARDPIKRFLKSIKLEPLRDTRLLKLHVENKDPELAAKIANFMSRLYVERNLYYISRNELLNLLKNEYLKLEAKLSEYSNIYKEQHPEMIRLNNEIAEITRKIEETKKNTYDFNVLTAGEQKYPLTGLKANNVSIQDAAEVPRVPVRPRKQLNILLAIVFGALGGLGLVFSAEYLDDTIKSQDDIDKLGLASLLGAIPRIEDLDKAASKSDAPLKKEFIAHVKPMDPISEAFRVLRTSLIYSATEEHPLRSLLVTSAGPGEGKTTMLSNLAIVMTQAGKKVLVVDTDMRKPRLHGIFGKSNRIGLSSFLCGQSDFDEVVQDTEIQNLSLVTSGTHPPNPSELLQSGKFNEFVKSAEKKFDLILFDTPPVGVVTDAVIISRLVAGIIIVVESGKTPLRALLRVLRILRESKARISGAVLNKLPINSHSDYYYYSHYYRSTE